MAALAVAALSAVIITERQGAAQSEPPLFAVDLSSCSYGGGAVGDLDGDGTPEIVFGTYYNDERVLALRSDGSLLWQVPSGGGPVDNSVTVADLDGDGRPEVVWGNSESTVLHVADAGGRDIWTRTIGEVLDAPKAVADVNGDGRLDLVVASCGAKNVPGGLRAFDGATGRLLWTATQGGCYQSAPLVFDQDGDGRLDIVVSTWFDNKVRGFAGTDGRLRWETTIGDYTYHAGSVGDLNGDGVPDVALGDYSATLWAIDGSNGNVLWQRELVGARYVFGPTAMGDLDGDGTLEVAVAGDNLQVFDAAGRHERTIDLPGYAARGPVLADVDGDLLPDIVVALDGPYLQAYRGVDGTRLFSRQLAPAGSFDFQPLVWDLDADGQNEVFGVYGRGQSDTPLENWGRAVALRLGGGGPGWPTFSHDVHHTGHFGWPMGPAANTPPGPTATAAPPTPSESPTPAATATAPGSSPTAQPAGGRLYMPQAGGLRAGGAEPLGVS